MGTCPDAQAVLNRLLRVLYRSLPVYLAEVRPWGDKDGETAQVVELVAADQLRLAQRVAEAIHAFGGRVEPGSFPVEFTSKHDLGLEYLLKVVVEHLRRDAAEVEACVAELACEPHLRSLAEEALGNTRGHLETLREMMHDEK